MYCDNCGKQVEEGKLFCKYCGSSQNKPAPQTEPYQDSNPDRGFNSFAPPLTYAPQAPAEPIEPVRAGHKSILGRTAALTTIAVVIICTASYFLFFAEPRPTDTAGTARQSSSSQAANQTTQNTSKASSTTTPVVTATAPAATALTAQDVAITARLGGAERQGVYSGEINSEGLPHGQGVFRETDSGVERSYEGSWVSGQATGTGVLSEGSYVFSGSFADGSTNGSCRITDGGILRYEGECLNGSLHGQGSLYTKSGTLMYTGEFDQDMLLESATDREARGLAFAPACAGMDELLYAEAMAGDALFGEPVVVWGSPLGLSKQGASGTIILAHMDDEQYPICLLYRYGVDEAKISGSDYVNAWGVLIGQFEYEDANGLLSTCPMVEVIYMRPDPTE